MGTRPVIGHLVGTSMLEPGGSMSWPGDTIRAETELGLVVGRRSGAVAGMCVALEIVDLGPPRGDVARVIAANVFHRAFALGPITAPAPTSGRRATLAVGGEVRGEGRLLEDYSETVRDAADLLAQLGESLEPGDVVIAGSAVHVPVAQGDRITCAIEGLGEVGAHLAQASTLRRRKPLKERTRRNVDLGAACIAGAIPRSSYTETIEVAGFEIEQVRRNDYDFISERALDACSTHEVRSISLAAVKAV